jgi:hypothetical protein
VPYGSKVQAPFFAATDASQLCEQQPTLRRRKVTNNAVPAESANAGQRMPFPEGACGLATARTRLRAQSREGDTVARIRLYQLGAFAIARNS